MAGSFFDYWENKVLDKFLGSDATAIPATVYAALSTTTPTDAGGNITEPSGNNYSRVAVTNNSTNFPNASGGAKSNGAAITFPTASGSWGTVTHVVFYDASSAGNALFYADLTVAKAIASGDTASFATSALTFSLT